MFTSPYALRSASCAALIALVTAAGIKRVPKATSPAPTPAPQPVRIVVAAVDYISPTETRVAQRPRLAAMAERRT